MVPILLGNFNVGACSGLQLTSRRTNCWSLPQAVSLAERSVQRGRRLINKPPPLDRDYNKMDPNIKALKRRRCIN